MINLTAITGIMPISERSRLRGFSGRTSHSA